jgi:16S rRNA (adenine(1408)-N(1))-methyltransferase
VAEPSDNSKQKPLKSFSLSTGEGIVIDIGTGDGLFAYQCARLNPNKLYIGIDANPRPLEKISKKVFRKPAKGGAPNAIFLQASIDELPSELDDTADEVHIHFPWGSLLQGIARGDERTLQNLRRLCAPEALLEIVLAIDPDRDQTEIKRLDIPVITLAYIDSKLSSRFRRNGFEIVERGKFEPTDWPALRTSWAKRLSGSNQRPLTYIVAQAVDALP